MSLSLLIVSLTSSSQLFNFSIEFVIQLLSSSALLFLFSTFKYFVHLTSVSISYDHYFDSIWVFISFWSTSIVSSCYFVWNIFLCFFIFHDSLCWFMCIMSEKAMAPHSSILAWKIPWMEEPGRLQSMGSLRVGHKWATSLSLFTFMHWRKWQPTPVFLPGESQGWGSLVGCHLWGRTESDTTEAT